MCDKQENASKQSEHITAFMQQTFITTITTST